jgi:hypothetical protein
MLATIGAPSLCLETRLLHMNTAVPSKGTRENCDLLDPLLLRAHVTWRTDIYLSTLSRRGLTYRNIIVRQASYYLGVSARYNPGRAARVWRPRLEVVGFLTASLRPVKVQTGRDMRTAALMDILSLRDPSRTFDIMHPHHCAPFDRTLSHGARRAFPPFPRTSKMDV